MAARIFQPARNAMQSGNSKSDLWLLQFDAETPRTSEPLMGWTSSSDTRQQIKMRFKSKEDAIAYAKREGIAFSVQEDGSGAVARRPQKSYADNFKFGRSANWTH
ncbi:hypothetical protein MNBD_ALPHA08-395 [hydrothermal vent metagenome]|uniref:ETC complex I subunit n=1 Tax=hydrothermal vent metagenome TaxID=652676 RepID=A0A3B0R4Q7_9ZZZZ